LFDRRDGKGTIAKMILYKNRLQIAFLAINQWQWKRLCPNLKHLPFLCNRSKPLIERTPYNIDETLQQALGIIALTEELRN
jgi:hypothetical protein